MQIERCDELAVYESFTVFASFDSLRLFYIELADIRGVLGDGHHEPRMARVVKEPFQKSVDFQPACLDVT